MIESPVKTKFTVARGARRQAANYL